MSEQPDKFYLYSMDLAEEKKAELLRLFPEIRTEGGKIDFERLKANAVQIFKTQGVPSFKTV